MKLTGRQEEFLAKFLDLYAQVQEPLHYTQVAEVLGVGKITAYDMLRLLEKMGFEVTMDTAAGMYQFEISFAGKQTRDGMPRGRR